MNRSSDEDERDLDDAVPVHLPPAEGPRPDWLLDAAVDPMEDGVAPSVPLPKLFPGAPPPAAPPRRSGPPAPRPIPEAPVARMETMPSMPSGEPMLPASEGYVPPPEPEPEPSGPVAWTAAASSVPVVRSRHRTSLDEFEEPEVEAVEETDAPPELREAEAAARAVSHAPIPSEPFWLIAIDEIRTNRKIQIGIVVILALILVIANAPWKDHGVRVARVLSNASELDGKEVRVSGKVGEVFLVGAGYAFYLYDGRDSIVVFTKSFTPLKNTRIQVHGTVSTGMLDGKPRAAIFEIPDPKGS